MIKPLLAQSDKDKEVYAHNTYSDQEELSLMQTHGLQKDYNNGKPTERLKESNRRKFKKPCRVKSPLGHMERVMKRLVRTIVLSCSNDVCFVCCRFAKSNF